MHGLGTFTWASNTASARRTARRNFLRAFPLRSRGGSHLGAHLWVQDDRHATRNLTVRREHLGQLTSATGQRPLIPGSARIRSASATLPANWKQFAPRFGFAYNADQGWVVRGGSGISYFASDFAGGSVNLLDPPFATVNFTSQLTLIAAS
jgi:hypothetical protein